MLISYYPLNLINVEAFKIYFFFEYHSSGTGGTHPSPYYKAALTAKSKMTTKGFHNDLRLYGTGIWRSNQLLLNKCFHLRRLYMSKGRNGENKNDILVGSLL